MLINDKYKIPLAELFPSQVNFNAPCVPYPDGTEGCWLDSLSSMYLRKLKNQVNKFFFQMSDLARQLDVEGIYEQSPTELRFIIDDVFVGGNVSIVIQYVKGSDYIWAGSFYFVG